MLPPRPKDFPGNSVKGSVALLRSKFGDPTTTDTSQIFGASPLSRSKTFHATSQTSSNNKYNSSPRPADTTLKSNKLTRTRDPNKVADAIDKNNINAKKVEYSRISTENNNNIPLVGKGEKDNSAALEIIPTVSTPSRLTANQKSIGKDGEPVVSHTRQQQPSQINVVLDTGQKHFADQKRTDQTDTQSTEGEKPTKVEDRLAELPTAAFEPIAGSEMAEKYSHITSIDELNAKLKDTRNFEERRALRAAIRKLRDAPGGPTSQSRSTTSKLTSPDDFSSDLDLTSYTTEEDLKILLHQTSKYEDKKRIRAAIREMRKKPDNLNGVDKISSEKSQSSRRPSPTSADDSSQQVSTTDNCQQLSRVKTDKDEIASPPATPDTLSLLRHSQREPFAKDTADDVLVSPIKHESRTLQRADGDVQIERVSKHSRTTSHSDVYEKSTKVTKTSKVGDLSISEQDEIITKEKLSLKGSITTEAEVKHKLDISERNGARRIEEDISIQKSLSSKTKGEESQSTVEVSIVREKLPLKVLNGLEDKMGIDGESLTWVCEFDNSTEDTQVIWLKDGHIIKADKDLKISWTNSTAEMCIKELLYPDDTGRYTCKAKNKHESVESSAQLIVKEPPKPQKPLRFTTELADSSVKDGDKEFVLKCELAEKADDAEVAWYKNGKLLKDNAEFKQRFDGIVATLTISEIFPEDSGEYECSVVRGSQESSTYGKVKVEDEKDEKIASLIVSKRSETISDKVKGDANNNLSENGETTNNVTNGETTIKDSVEESSIAKCEKVLEAATIKDDASSVKIKDEAADVEEKEKSKPRSNDSVKTPSAITKPALKPILKPSNMSRPTTGKAAPGGSRGAMAAFKQMDTANNPNAAAAPKPNSGVAFNSIPVAKQAAKMIKRRAIGMVEIKQEMLTFCSTNTAEYENVKIDNFSTSWNNGVAFLALIHHFYPDSFEWDKVDERRRRENFQLAFDLAEKKADIAPLLEVDDMVRMKKPDWKCVFTYVQSFYRKLRDHENNRHTYMQS